MTLEEYQKNLYVIFFILQFEMYNHRECLPVSEFITPLRIKKSIVTGQLVVFISGRHKRDGNYKANRSVIIFHNFLLWYYVHLTQYRRKISIVLTSAAFTKVNSSTSPSLFSGLKSIGSSKSNTNSVCGKIPLSDSKKNLIEIKRYIIV